jgi:GNAT superfamily N-acetyltransferase
LTTSGQVIIRDATPDDVPQMAVLMGELGYPTSATEMAHRFDVISKHPDYRTLLAEKDGVIVGLIGLARGHYYEHNGNYIRILAFIVSASCRGEGIGKQLLSSCEQWAKETGIAVLILNSGNREERRNAFKFYQQQGFELKSSGFVKNLTNN